MRMKLSQPFPIERTAGCMLGKRPHTDSLARCSMPPRNRYDRSIFGNDNVGVAVFLEALDNRSHVMAEIPPTPLGEAERSASVTYEPFVAIVGERIKDEWWNTALLSPHRTVLREYQLTAPLERARHVMNALRHRRYP